MADSDKKRRYCEHCDEYLNLRTYRRHVQLYFDRLNMRWKQKHSCGDLSDDEFPQVPGEQEASRQDFYNRADGDEGQGMLYA